MPPDDRLMLQIDELLRHEPMWDPPRGFAARVAASAPRPVAPRAPSSVAALFSGLGLAAVAIAAAVVIAGMSERYLDTTTRVLTMNPVAVGWGCVGAMLVTAFLFPAVWFPESESA